ncbi:MAG: amidase [Pseudomonadota bacterium]
MSEDKFGAFCAHNPVSMRGVPGGPLSGLRLGVKDVFDIAGHRTGAGNPDWLRTHEPAERSASAVQKLLDAGADVVGKTQTDELAYSLNGENLHYGTPRNPRTPERIPGGSSSGSAVAVAAGLCDLALGTDTAGSIRLPASFCGIYGFRPSHGVVANDGVVPLAPSYDTVGWMAPDPLLLAAAGNVLLPGQPVAEARRLIIAQDALALASDAVRQALAPCIEQLAGAFPGTVSVALAPEGLLAWQQIFRVIQGFEVWQTHGPWITSVQPTFGPGIRERFQWAATITREDAEAASSERRRISDALDRLLQDAVICLPTVAMVAPLKGSPTAEEDRTRALSLLCIASLARLPQVTLPVAHAGRCPVGLSLIGARNADRALLDLACRLVPAVFGGAAAGSPSH